MGSLQAPHTALRGAAQRAHTLGPQASCRGHTQQRRKCSAGSSDRGCRCHAAPEGAGGGKSAFNLRAWGAGLVNNLRLGFAEQQQKRATPPAPVEDAAPPAAAAVAAAEEPGQREATPSELRVVPSSADKEGSWEHWQQYFDDMDALYEQACELESAVEQAAAAEQYDRAAEHAAEYKAVQQRDVVAGIMQELSAAVAGEDYGRAAELRDAGCAGLVGWWASRAEGDPAGHLLRVAPDFGRYSAIMYTPRDFAELKGWGSVGEVGYSPYGGMSALPWQSSGLVAAGEQSGPDGSDVEYTMQELGVPVMEIFVRRDSEGRLVRQACVLKQDRGGGAGAGSNALLGALSADGRRPALDIHVDHAGTGTDVLAMRITLNPNGTPQVDTGTVEDMGLSGMSITGPYSTPEEALAAAAAAGLPSGGQAGGDGAGGADSEGASDDQAPHHMPMQHFERAPAAVTRMDNNNFVLSVPSAAPAAPAQDSDDGDDDEPDQVITVTGDPHLLSQQEIFAQLREALALTGDGPPVGGGDPDGPMAGVVIHDTFIVPRSPAAADEAQQQEEASTSGKDDEGAADAGDGARSAAGAEDDGADTWRRAAREVARLHAQRHPGAPLAISGDELAEVLRSAASGAVDVLQQSLDPPHFCLEGTTLYSRIRPDLPRTDPFSGLYLGTFAPHGPEILQLQRSVTEDGEECVLGVKLTGDPNVPAGSVSFRAKIGRAHRRSGYDLMYPPELDIAARYAGEGRVAHKGFKDARWVEGELLHFSGSNPVTKGAELGFVWVVPQERRYLILLSRIDLDDPRLNT